MRQPAVPHGLAVLNSFLSPLLRDQLTLLTDMTVMRKREKHTSMRRGLSALSRLEIDGRADVRSSGSRQKREEKRFGAQGTVLKYSTDSVWMMWCVQETIISAANNTAICHVSLDTYIAVLSFLTRLRRTNILCCLHSLHWRPETSTYTGIVFSASEMLLRK